MLGIAAMTIRNGFPDAAAGAEHTEAAYLCMQSTYSFNLKGIG